MRPFWAFLGALMGLMIPVAAYAQDSAASYSPQQSIPIESQSDGTSIARPVLVVTSVELIRFTNAGDGGVVLVKGLMAPSMKLPAQLVQISGGIPADGVLDLAFVANTSGSTDGDLVPVEARYVFSGGLASARSVRVRSATNVILTGGGVSVFSGGPSPAVQREIVGKKIIVSAGHAPVIDGVSLSGLLSTRVVDPSSPLIQSDLDPNRLTIFVDASNVVLFSRWD